MKIAIFGASGKIGSGVVSSLASHSLIKIGRTSGDLHLDYTDTDAVKNAFGKIDRLDAVIVCVGGDSQFKHVSELTDDDYRFGAERKLVAQFRIVRLAENVLNDNGSITLTSGFLTDYPNPYSLATGPFNSAINTFVTQYAPMLQRGLRLNVVSPAPVVSAGQVRKGSISPEQVATYYQRSLEGNETGIVYRAWGGLEED